jgi:hypothetical protein
MDYGLAIDILDRHLCHRPLHLAVPCVPVNAPIGKPSDV